MELSKDTVRKIRGLILFAVAVVVAAVNYEVVLSVCTYLLGILSPFLVGGSASPAASSASSSAAAQAGL